MSQLQTVRAGSAVKLLETGTSCVSSTLPPLTVFCCLYYVLRVSNIYILSCYHNSPSCFTLILYLREFRTYRSPCLSLSEYFILTCSWVAWISLSSNSLKKGSCVLYSLCFFFFFFHTISLSLFFYLNNNLAGYNSSTIPSFTQNVVFLQCLLALGLLEKNPEVNRFFFFPFL